MTKNVTVYHLLSECSKSTVRNLTLLTSLHSTYNLSALKCGERREADAFNLIGHEAGIAHFTAFQTSFNTWICTVCLHHTVTPLGRY